MLRYTCIAAVLIPLLLACQTTTGSKPATLADFPKELQDKWHVKGLTLLPDGTLTPKEGIKIQPAEAGTNPVCAKYLGEGTGNWFDEYDAPRATVRVTIYHVKQVDNVCHVYFAVSTGIDSAGILNLTPGFTRVSGEIHNGALKAKFPKGPGELTLDGNRMQFLVHNPEFDNPTRAKMKWVPAAR